MIEVQIIYNLSVLASFLVLSGFIEKRWTRKSMTGQIIQGVLFGVAALIGMKYPFVLQEGLIFDGRSVVLSACGLFFGPIAGVISASMAAIMRIGIGGSGAYMGVAVIASASAIGIFYHKYRHKKKTPLTITKLYLIGLLVHIVMLSLMIFLPSNMRWETMKVLAFTILVFYPLASVVIGKILKDQEDNFNLIDELKEKEEDLTITINSIGDAVISTDAYGNITRMNPIAEKLCGYNYYEAKNKPLKEIFKIINEDTREEVANPVSLVMKTGEIIGLANHTVLISKEGNEFNIMDSAAPIKNKNGEIIGVVLVFSDITEKYLKEKEMKEILLNKEKRFREAFEFMPVPIGIAHEDGNILHLNNEFEKVFGYNINDIPMIKDWAMKAYSHNSLLIQYSEQWQKDVELAKINNTSTPEREYLVKCKNNGIKNVLISMRPVENNYITLFKDITESKKTHEMLLESENYRKRIFDSSRIPIVVMDTVLYKYTECNDAAVEIYGYKDKASVLGKTPVDMSTIRQYDGSLSIEKAQYFIDKAISQGSIVFEWRHQNPDGKIWDAEVHLLSFFIKDQQMLQFSLLDITEKKKALYSLKEEQLFSRKLLDSLPGIFYLYSYPELKLKLWNKNHEVLLGYTSEEIRNKSALDWHSQENKESVKFAIDFVMEKGENQIEAVLLKKTGEGIPFLLNGIRLERDEKVYLMGVGFDITERKQNEKEILDQMNELNRFNRLMVGREEKMIELKKEINKLLEEKGSTRKYDI